jgi:hypothetical protein
LIGPDFFVDVINGVVPIGVAVGQCAAGAERVVASLPDKKIHAIHVVVHVEVG